MHPLLYIMISVTIGALIGGITNYLAIKMLFLPRRTVYIAGRKLPFTPGLIPKRRDDIASSLGYVVAEYLVTSHGLTRMMRDSAFQSKLERAMRQFIEEQADHEQTVKEWFLSFGSEQQWAKGLENASLIVRRFIAQGVDRLWTGQLESGRNLGEWLNWNVEVRQKWLSKGSDYIVAVLVSELSSIRGEELLRSIIVQFVQRSGGWWGTLAGFFLDEDKLVVKVKGVLLQSLASETVSGRIYDALERQLASWEKMSLAEVISKLAEDEHPKQWSEHHIQRLLPLEEWLRNFGEWRISALIHEFHDPITRMIPVLATWTVNTLEKNMQHLVAAVELPRLVEHQVRQFPIERIEQIILNLSGQEFRAITWLGALLGGIIGLVQAGLTHWVLRGGG